MTTIHEGGQVSDAVTTGRVVVGIDDSPAARQALRYAADIAGWKKWTLHVVHAWHLSYPAGPYAIDLAEVELALAEAAREVVTEVEDDVLGQDHGLELRQTIAEGPAARVLIEESEGANLLVVGSRGRGGFASLALGSVGQACVHHAHCPVLVVRPRADKKAQ